MLQIRRFSYKNFGNQAFQGKEIKYKYRLKLLIPHTVTDH